MAWHLLHVHVAGLPYSYIPGQWRDANANLSDNFTMATLQLLQLEYMSCSLIGVTVLPW